MEQITSFYFNRTTSMDWTASDTAEARTRNSHCQSLHATCWCADKGPWEVRAKDPAPGPRQAPWQPGESSGTPQQTSGQQGLKTCGIEGFGLKPILALHAA